MNRDLRGRTGRISEGGKYTEEGPPGVSLILKTHPLIPDP